MPNPAGESILRTLTQQSGATIRSKTPILKSSYISGFHCRLKGFKSIAYLLNLQRTDSISFTLENALELPVQRDQKAHQPADQSLGFDARPLLPPVPERALVKR